MKVRMMLPMSVRCSTCGNFMYKGTKFNTRMEDVKGENYLGLRIFRFYYRCTNCSAEFCMKTDPQTADYIVEGGASRNYEPWRDKAKSTAQAVAEREEEEKGNAMKALENRTLDSKREMDILTALDEVRSLKARHESVNTEAALAALRRASEEEQPVDLDAEDEEAVRQWLFQRTGFIQRLSDSEGSDGDGGAAGETQAGLSRAAGAASVEGIDIMDVIESGGREAKRSRNLGPSVAAAAWEDADEGEDGAAGADRLNKFREGEDRVKDDNLVGTLGSESAHVGGCFNTSGDGGDGGFVSDGGERGLQRKSGLIDTSISREGGQRLLKEQQQQLQKVKPPPSVPSFSARPAAVLVKKKVVPKPVAPVEKEREEEEDGGALLGLSGYGSDSD